MGPQIYIKAEPGGEPYFGSMNLNRLVAAVWALCAAVPMLSQDCPDGQQPFALHLHTDAWGYELYWELTPEGDACGTNTLYWGGNALGVGCDGDGIDGAPEGAYASNASFITDTLCGTPGEALTLHHVDSYGDGGTYFEVYAGGVLNHAWLGTGMGNEWTFDPFEMSGPAYDSPCGAAEIEVDGAMVIVSNDSCSAAYGEPGAPNFPGVYSCQINGGWCETGVTGSAWLTFTATEGNCWITACTDSTDFDTQIALWKADDCGDFGTYTLVAANDDLPGGCGPGAYYASAMWSGCLDAGETYLIQVDGWQNARGQAGVLIESVEDGPQVTSSTGGLACALGKEQDPNGTIVLNITGTGGDYSAAWVGPDGYSASGQQISGLGSGTYSAAIVTSCGNTLTHTVTLTEPDPIVLDIELVHPGCPELPNGEAYLGASGGTQPYEIVWSGLFGDIGTGEIVEGLAEGDYAVVLEDDNGCTAELSFSLAAEDDAFSFSLGPDTTICEDEQLVLSAPAGLDYLWSNGSVDQFIIVNGADLGPGTYPITVEASNEFGCSHADAIFVTVFDCTTGIEEADGGPVGPQVLPNPAGDGAAWAIRWGATGATVEHAWILRDALGRAIRSGVHVETGAGEPLMLSTQGMATGTYLLELTEERRALRLIRN